MKKTPQPPARRNVRIVVNPKDPRMATVVHDRETLFTIKTDVSGKHPALVIVATLTHLKTMARGTTGITLWNGTSGSARITADG